MMLHKAVRISLAAMMVMLVVTVASCRPAPAPAPENPAPSPAPAQGDVPPAAATAATENSTPAAGSTASLTAPAPTPAAGATTSPAPGGSGAKKFIVYYFYTTTRCAHCYRVEEYTRDTVKTIFPDQLKSGEMEFHAFNVDEPDHKHFVKDYALLYKAIVLVETVDGKQTRFKNLGTPWEDHPGREALIAYLGEQTRAFMAAK